MTTRARDCAKCTKRLATLRRGKRILWYTCGSRRGCSTAWRRCVTSSRSRRAPYTCVRPCPLNPSSTSPPSGTGSRATESARTRSKRCPARRSGLPFFSASAMAGPGRPRSSRRSAEPSSAALTTSTTVSSSAKTSPPSRAGIARGAATRPRECATATRTGRTASTSTPSAQRSSSASSLGSAERSRKGSSTRGPSETSASSENSTASATQRMTTFSHLSRSTTEATANRGRDRTPSMSSQPRTQRNPSSAPSQQKRLRSKRCKNITEVVVDENPLLPQRDRI
mmetsp:Transcript_1160/g.4325  ORF Transcript_1160/g.4325 Transcript_1160/m.4325 type:complete len:283 (+) Transcript_1160:240-1088(+)